MEKVKRTGEAGCCSSLDSTTKLYESEKKKVLKKLGDFRESVAKRDTSKSVRISR